jgi:hypothetical protein
MAGPNAFLIKDVVLLGVSVYLLKQDAVSVKQGGALNLSVSARRA